MDSVIGSYRVFAGSVYPGTENGLNPLHHTPYQDAAATSHEVTLSSGLAVGKTGSRYPHTLPSTFAHLAPVSTAGPQAQPPF